MNVYFVDRPLTDEQLTELGRVLRGSYSVRIELALRQRRLPAVLLAPDLDGRHPLPLRSYVPLLATHFRRVGLARGLPAALVLPQASPLAGAIALALKSVLGRAPYLVARRDDDSASVRVIRPNAIRHVIETEATDPASLDEP